MLTPHRPPFLCIFIALLCALTAARANESSRERLSLNEGWRFQKNDPAGTGDQLSYSKIKDWLLPAGNEFTKPESAKKRPEGEPPGAKLDYVQTGFDDSGWRTLNLPHDWAIEGPFDQALAGEIGKLPSAGVGWYRKHFTVDVEQTSGLKYYLEIDGAMSYATVWCNGQLVGGWPYGYASFRLDLTPYLKTGAENILAIRLDNPSDSARWYPGGGIYRNVWLLKTSPVHLAHWGTHVTTQEVSATSATVKIAAQLDNPSDTKVSLNTIIYEADASGQRTGKPVGTVDFPVGQDNVSLQIKNPQLWTLEKPSLYVAVTYATVGKQIVDAYETTFGIRTIEFTVNDGFHLNGLRVPIRGVCEHHDLGALGSAINLRALQRKIEILQEMGCNAIRTSHNPPAPELLDLCDRMGMLVMDEFVDCWKKRKRKNDYNVLFDDWSEKDLRALVRRDHNHPCVILWSIGNEINEQGAPEGPEMEKALSAFVKLEDTTRPTTIAVSSTLAGFAGFQTGIDVFDYNYKPLEYQKFREKNPTIPIFGSETASTVSSRGEYFFPVSEKKEEGKSDFQVSSYDLYHPGWATRVDAEFKGQESNPFVAGEFVWTGFDYLGEPSPYNNDSTVLLNYHTPETKAAAALELQALGKIRVPSRSSYFGIIDLAGFKKDRYYLYQAHWRPDFPMAHILPHWNWAGREGEITPVHVYTSGDEAELFLNGKSLGKKKKGQYEYRLRWDDVKYEPGELKVVAFKNGKEWAADLVKTTGPAAKLLLQPDRATIQADGRDLSYVTLTVADAAGRMVPRSGNPVKFTIEGPGEIVATDNGDATDHTTFSLPNRKAYNGLALAIVRTKPGARGPITLHASSDGLTTAQTTLNAQP